MSPAPAGATRRLVLVLAASFGVLTAMTALGASAQSEPSWQSRRHADATASAIAGPRAKHVADKAYQAVRVPFRRVKADATANASATCNGCGADASTLQILYVDGESGSTVNNVAAAWSRCVRCRATALSVQVVVVRGHPRIRANNRALAVNAGCRRCHTASAAFQVVVAGEWGPRFSSSDRQELRDWVVEQAETLRAGATSDTDGSSLQELTQLVNDALGTRTLKRRAQLRAP